MQSHLEKVTCGETKLSDSENHTVIKINRVAMTNLVPILQVITFMKFTRIYHSLGDRFWSMDSCNIKFPVLVFFVLDCAAC